MPQELTAYATFCSIVSLCKRMGEGGVSHWVLVYLIEKNKKKKKM